VGHTEALSVKPLAYFGPTHRGGFLLQQLALTLVYCIRHGGQNYASHLPCLTPFARSSYVVRFTTRL
jgi:hypothetical protein